MYTYVGFAYMRKKAWRLGADKAGLMLNYFTYTICKCFVVDIV